MEQTDCHSGSQGEWDPSKELEFDSEAEALQFYNLYSWEVGFGIHKGHLDGNKDGYQTVRDIVCHRQVSY